MIGLTEKEKKNEFRTSYPIPHIEKSLGVESVTVKKINYNLGFASLHLLAQITSVHQIANIVNVDWDLYKSNPCKFFISIIEDCMKAKITKGLLRMVNTALAAPTINLEKTMEDSVISIYNGLRDDQVLCANVLLPILSSNISLWEASNTETRIVGIKGLAYNAISRVCTGFRTIEELDQFIHFLHHNGTEWGEEGKFLNLDSSKIISPKVAKKMGYIEPIRYISSNNKQKIRICIKLIDKVKDETSRKRNLDNESSNLSSEHKKKISKKALDKVRRELTFSSSSSSSSDSNDSEERTKAKRKTKHKRRQIPTAVRMELINKYFTMDSGICRSCHCDVEWNEWKPVLNSSRFQGNMVDNILINCRRCYNKSSRKADKTGRVPKSILDAVWNMSVMVPSTNCFVCNELVKWNEVHASHVLAQSMGGKDVVSNLRVCCSHCNLSMGKMHMMDYIRKYYPIHDSIKIIDSEIERQKSRNKSRNKRSSPSSSPAYSEE